MANCIHVQFITNHKHIYARNNQQHYSPTYSTSYIEHTAFHTHFFESIESSYNFRFVWGTAVSQSARLMYGEVKFDTNLNEVFLSDCSDNVIVELCVMLSNLLHPTIQFCERRPILTGRLRNSEVERFICGVLITRLSINGVRYWILTNVTCRYVNIHQNVVSSHKKTFILWLSL